MGSFNSDLYFTRGWGSILSSPENSLGGVNDSELDAKLSVFKASLETRLVARFKENVVVDVVKEFLRNNLNLVVRVNISIGEVSYHGVLILVGSVYSSTYQFSVFNVKVGSAVGLNLLSNALVVRIVNEFEVKWKTRS